MLSYRFNIHFLTILTRVILITDHPAATLSCPGVSFIRIGRWRLSLERLSPDANPAAKLDLLCGAARLRYLPPGEKVVDQVDKIGNVYAAVCVDVSR